VGVGNGRRGEEVDKGCGRVNMVQHCVHTVNEKMIAVESILGMGGGGIK
jgi:hypothetical protein